MNPLISIVRNWSVLAVAQVVSSLIGLALMVFVSRNLGDAAFGNLYLALTLTTIVGVLVDFGLSQVVARAVARERALARTYFRRAAAVIAVGGAVLYVATVVVSQSLGYTADVRILILILGLLMVTEGFSQLFAALFQAHEKMLVPAIARVAGNAVTLAIAAALVLRGFGAPAVAVVMVAGAVMRLGMQAAAARRLSGFSLPALPVPSTAALVRTGLPFLASQALGMFVFRVDVLILGVMSTAATVGWYGAASRVVESLNFIPLVLTTATFPVASRLWVAAPAEFRTTVRKTFDLLLVVAVPLMVVLFMLAEEVIGLLFTLDRYAPAVPILRIQSISLGLIFVDYLLACVLMASGRERRWIVILGSACVLNPALNWVLIPATTAAYSNGAIGAALATLLTELFILGLALRAIPAQTFDAGALRSAARVGALGAALALVLALGRALGAPWVLSALVGGAGYALAVVWLGLLPQDITSWVRGFVRRGDRMVPPLEMADPLAKL